MKKHMFKILTATAFAFCLLTACDSDMYTVSAQLNEPVYERPVSPGSGYVWVSGDWVWGGNGYTYRQGYWSRPRGTRVWASGTWESRNGGYRWRRGHWN
jgi:hypothetical protein